MKPTRRIRHSLSRLWRDKSGNYVMITALMAPVLLGGAGLATEGGLWYYVHQSVQGAADSSALSAANMASLNAVRSPTTQAQSVAATYGYVNGTAGATVTVNRPPVSGALPQLCAIRCPAL